MLCVRGGQDIPSELLPGLISGGFVPDSVQNPTVMGQFLN